MSDRHLVAVSWSMPPALFPRSIQISRLLKGLQRTGWNSTVVTLDAASRPMSEPLDPTLLEHYAHYYTTERVSLATPVSRWPDLRLRWHFDDSLTELDRGWAAHAAETVQRVARRAQSRVLVTFAQPWRDHFVGLAIGRPRLPWVAHFSDPWVDSLYYDHLVGAARDLERERESRVIRYADRLIFTNEYAADLVMRKYPKAWRRRVRVVEHAADPDLVSAADALRRPLRAGPLRLSYVGSLLVGRRTADDLLDALAMMHLRQALDGRLELIVVGSGSGTQQAKRKVLELGLKQVVTFTPHVTHLESLAAMRDSDALLLIDASAETNVFLPSKLVDYLAADRPILAVTPAAGPSADLMRACGYPALEPGDVDGIVAALDGLLRRRAAGTLTSSTPPDVVQRYTLDAVAAKVAVILDEVADEFSWRKRWLFTPLVPPSSGGAAKGPVFRVARFLWRLLPPRVRAWRHRLLDALNRPRPGIPVRRIVRRLLTIVRRPLRALTLAPFRESATLHWPEARGVDRVAMVAALVGLRLHGPALRVVWRFVHVARRWRRPRPPGRPIARVLHVTSSFDLGGTQRQIKNLCTVPYTRFRHDTTEIFPELNYLFRRGVALDPDRYTAGGVINRALGRFVLSLNTRSPQLVQAYKLACDFRALAPDVVVGWGHEMSVTTFVAATIARVPEVVFCIRTLNPAYGWVSPPLGRLLGVAHRRLTPHVSAVIANSSVVRDDYTRWLGLPAGVVSVCANGIDVSAMSPAEIAERRVVVRRELGIADETFVAVNVGRFSIEKGQMSILELNTRLLANGDAHRMEWLLCGDGPVLESARRFADAHGMTNVRFLGRTERVSDFLCASDLFVMPSVFEGMPNAMMEAMAHGLPCVSTNRSGAIDIARDGEEALYYAPGDIDAMERHVRWALEHRDAARAMGRRAQARLADFSVGASVERFETILETR